MLRATYTNNNSSENNLRYDFNNDLELMKKIDNYNQIYNNNNNNKNPTSNNNNINNNYININVTPNSSNMNIPKETRISSVGKNKSCENFTNSKEIPISDSNIDIGEMETEYYAQITYLKEQLFITRSERKKKEDEAKIIKHRLLLLKNQEQSAFIQLQNIKQQIIKILNNRKNNEEKAKQKLIMRKNLKNSFDGSKTSASFKKNTSSSNLFKRGSKKKFSAKSNTQNNFYPGNMNIYNEDKEKITDRKTEEITKNIGINLGEMKETITDENDIKVLKLHLIEKLKEDDEKRLMLENEIAKIEKEENKIINIIQRKKSNNQNNTGDMS